MEKPRMIEVMTAEYLPKALGGLWYGYPVEKLTRDEALAMAAFFLEHRNLMPAQQEDTSPAVSVKLGLKCLALELPHAVYTDAVAPAISLITRLTDANRGLLRANARLLEEIEQLNREATKEADDAGTEHL